MWKSGKDWGGLERASGGKVEVEKWESWWESRGFTHEGDCIKVLHRFFTRDLHGDFHEGLGRFPQDFHRIKFLFIEVTPDFFDLAPEFEIGFEVVRDFFDAVHDGGVIGDADFGGDLIGAEVEIVFQEIHRDLARVFNICDAGFTFQGFDRHIIILRDFRDDLFRGSGGMVGGGAREINHALVDDFEWGAVADFGGREDGV